MGRSQFWGRSLAIFGILIALLVLSAPNPQHAVTFTDTGGSNSQSNTPTISIALRDTWPKKVDDFLAGEYLQKADVMLEQRWSGDVAAWVIRWATNSLFSHAALVYTAPPYDSGVANTFVIEAGTKGVGLTKLTDYVHDSHVNFIAIKRLKPASWFDSDRQARVRGLLLDKIKAHYDYWTVWQIARQIWFGVEEKVSSRQKTLESYREKDWTPPNEFICSGLVQIGYVEMMVEAIKNGQISPEALRDVVFTKSAERYLPIRGQWSSLGDQQKETAAIFRQLLNDELFSVTPEDLGQTDKLDWKYLIKGDKVYKISSYAELQKLIH
jgi:DNA-binding transcriptional regulator YdaS (Cro superfamily)